MDAPSSNLVARAAAVLRAVAAHEPDGTSTANIARTAHLARPTTHRLLSSLLTEGLVDRSDTGAWLLGPELFLLGTAAKTRYDVRDEARPWVRKLAERTGESAFYSTVRADETVCLVREDGAFPVRSHVLYEGARFPLGVVSAGIVVLAFLPEREVIDFLDGHDLTQEFGAMHSRAQTMQRLEETKRTGWSLNPGLLVAGSWGMAAAVFLGSRPVGALTLTGIESRFGAARQPELGQTLLKAAHGLGQALARRPVLST